MKEQKELVSLCTLFITYWKFNVPLSFKVSDNGMHILVDHDEVAAQLLDLIAAKMREAYDIAEDDGHITPVTVHGDTMRFQWDYFGLIEITTK